MSKAKEAVGGLGISPDGPTALKAVFGAVPPLELLSARVWVSEYWPYVIDALFALTLVEVKGLRTVGVDKFGRLYYDPEVFTKPGPESSEPWTVEGMGYALLHEISHRLHGHCERAEEIANVDHALFNLAADAAIHSDEETFGVGGRNLPVKDPILPKYFDLPPGLMAEEYYEAGLKQSKSKQAAGSGSPAPGEGAPMPGAGNCGSAADGAQRAWEVSAPGSEGGKDSNGKEVPGLSAGEWEFVKRQVAERIKRGEAGPRGTIPAGWGRWADKVINPRIDPAKLLAGAIHGALNDARAQIAWTYRRPNRSRQGTNVGDLIYPGIWRPGPRAAIVVDCSGSVDQEQLELGLGVIRRVLTTQGCAGLKVYACDAQVHAAKTVFNERQVVLSGGGGTDMAVGVRAALYGRPEPNVVILLTDGETPYPERHELGRARLVVVLVEPRSQAVIDAVPGHFRTVVVRHPDRMPVQDSGG